MTVEERIQNLLNELNIKYPPAGFYIGNGWFPYVERAIRSIHEMGITWDLEQVTEKFCGLRMYVAYYDVTELESDKIREIVKDTELACSTICINCGKPHGIAVPARGIPCCKLCLKKV